MTFVSSPGTACPGRVPGAPCLAFETWVFTIARCPEDLRTEVEHDPGVGIDCATGTARLGSYIESADIEGVGDGDIEAKRNDGRSAGVGSRANLVVDQLGVGGGADHTCADFEVGPEWNVMGYKANAKGGRAGSSALGTGILGQPKVKTHCDPARDGKVVKASYNKTRRT